MQHYLPISDSTGDSTIEKVGNWLTITVSRVPASLARVGGDSPLSFSSGLNFSRTTGVAGGSRVYRSACPATASVVIPYVVIHHDGSGTVTLVVVVSVVIAVVRKLTPKWCAITLTGISTAESTITKLMDTSKVSFSIAGVFWYCFI